MEDRMARGGVRRYLDSVTPAEYLPDVGEVNLQELTLTGLCDLYGSDKGTIKHRYADIYEGIIYELTAKKNSGRKQCALRIAEVGIACGASLRAFANYLPRAMVYGYDIRPACGALCADLSNVEITITDPAGMAPPDAQFDIFIDDASHISEKIVGMFDNCWQWVKPGGFYVIEDLKCTYDPAYTQQFKKIFDPAAVNDRAALMGMMDVLMRRVDARHNSIGEFRYYPQMLVIKKSD